MCFEATLVAHLGTALNLRRLVASLSLLNQLFLLLRAQRVLTVAKGLRFRAFTTRVGIRAMQRVRVATMVV